MTLAVKISSLIIGLVSFIGGIGYILSIENTIAINTVIKWFSSVLLVLLGAAALDFSRLCPATAQYPVRDLLFLYVTNAIIQPLLSYKNDRYYNYCAKHMDEEQEKYLLEYIDKNKDTEFGKTYGFAEIHSVREFVRRVPLFTQADLRTYCERTARGEMNVLVAETPVMMAQTTGTSGVNCVWPLTRTMMRLMMVANSLLTATLRRYFRGTRELRKKFFISYLVEEGRTEAGYLIGPTSLAFFKSVPKSFFRGFSAPVVYNWTCSERAALYIHLLFGLRDKAVAEITTTFASTLYTVMCILEDQWQQLVKDIREGVIGPHITLDEDTRRTFLAQLHPDPARADELEAEFQKGFDAIVSRVWPDIRVISTVDTGSNKIYGDLLRKGFCRGLPFNSFIYNATEGVLGVGLWPLSGAREYALLPFATFYEFIKIEDSDQEKPKTYLPNEVVAGHTYELVITTVNGVCRYRFGDVITVTRFYHTVPVVTFQYRIGQLLNLVNEKTSETSVYEMVTSTVKAWPDAELTDYTCAVSPLVDDVTGEKRIVSNYFIFVELTTTRHISDEERQQMDTTLRGISVLYDTVRRGEEIGPIEVKLVKKGAFRGLRDYLISNTGANGIQYKTPRVLKRKGALRFMLDQVE